MSKTVVAALLLSVASAFVFGANLSVKAISSNINLEVTVGPAIALSIQSDSDDDRTYGQSDPTDQKVMDYTGQGITSFGASKSTTSMLPNTKNTSMWSKVRVYTNNIEGYQLTISDADNDTSLVSGTHTIPATNQTEIGVSSWSFYGGLVADYTAMSPLSSPITINKSETKSAANGDLTEVHYVVSTSGDQPTGVYTDTIVYTVTAEVTERAEYMQDFDASTMLLNEHDTAILTDKRDGKTYTVARLRDGNVWMTQNLALDLDSSKVYTPNDTDIYENWTPIRSTIQNNNLNTTTWKTDNSTPYSYMSNVATDGNYYNWSAAVAMNDSSTIITGNASTSICPKGWTLPENGTTGKTYANLDGAYELRTTNGNTSTAYQVLEAAPLSFVRAGYINTSALKSYGSIGTYWSSTSYNGDSSAYRSYYSTTQLYPQSFLGRSVGMNVRCVAR